METQVEEVQTETETQVEQVINEDTNEEVSRETSNETESNPADKEGAQEDEQVEAPKVETTINEAHIWKECVSKGVTDAKLIEGIIDAATGDTQSLVELLINATAHAQNTKAPAQKVAGKVISQTQTTTPEKRVIKRV